MTSQRNKLYWIVFIVVLFLGAVVLTLKGIDYIQDRKEQQRVSENELAYLEKQDDRELINAIMNQKIEPTKEVAEEINNYQYCTEGMVLGHEDMSWDCATAIKNFSCGKEVEATEEKEDDEEEIKPLRKEHKPQVHGSIKELVLTVRCTPEGRLTGAISKASKEEAKPTKAVMKNAEALAEQVISLYEKGDKDISAEELSKSLTELYVGDSEPYKQSVKAFHKAHDDARLQIQTSQLESYTPGSQLSVTYLGRASLQKTNEEEAGVYDFELTVLVDLKENKLITSKLIYTK